MVLISVADLLVELEIKVSALRRKRVWVQSKNSNSKHPHGFLIWQKCFHAFAFKQDL